VVSVPPAQAESTFSIFLSWVGKTFDLLFDFISIPIYPDGAGGRDSIFLARIFLAQAGTPGSLWGHCPLALSKGGNRRTEVPFHNSVTSNFIVYQDRLETNLLQPFAHPENFEWFSISVIIFEVSIVAEPKQA